MSKNSLRGTPVSDTPIQVTFHDLARGGSGVARLETGEVVFVPFTAPGDEALIRITEKNKNYSHGELIEITKPSPNRVTPPCAVFGKCGGCDWQHLPYALQFQTKKKGLLQALKRAGVNTEEVAMDDLPAAQEYHYRNRIQLRGNSKAEALGFFAKGENQKIVNINRCEISDEKINAQLQSLKAEGFKKFDEEFKLEIEVSESGDVRSAWNQKHGALGFRQVNDAQNEVLKSWVASHLGKSEVLVDLFGGRGNLSTGLTDRFKKIHCVDVTVPTERPATLPEHFHFHESNVRAWLRRNIATIGAEFDPSYTVSVVLDPPREGLGGDFTDIHDSLVDLPLANVILVGCDVDSFVRDTQRFLQRGLKLKRLGILDLFPQTTHVESLALFTK